MQLNYLNLEHLYQLPCHVFWKDHKGIFQGSNDYPMLTAGAPNGADMLGLTDFDLIYSDYAHKYRQDDLRVLQKEQNLYTIEQVNFLNNTNHHTVHTHKQPLHDTQGNIVGVLGMCFYVAANAEKDILSQIAISSCLQHINAIDKEHIELTPRQEDCLFLLARGNTAKEIAHELNLSFRTVEQYIKDLRIKLNCTTRSALIAKALKQPSIKKRMIELMYAVTIVA